MKCTEFFYGQSSRYRHWAVIMMTSSDGNISRVTGHLCGEFTGPRWIPCTKASDAELWFFFDLRMNKRLSKQSWGWWFESPSWSLWLHCNDDFLSTWPLGQTSAILDQTTLITINVLTKLHLNMTSRRYWPFHRSSSALNNHSRLLLIWPLGTNFSETEVIINKISCKEITIEMSSAKWWPLCMR